MLKKFSVIALALIVIFMVQACSKFFPDGPAEDEILDGPVEGLTYEENALFLAGDVAFNNEIFTSATGLGPVFVANSCGSCHAGDGKGHPFTMLTRFGQTDSTGNKYLDRGGPQLQHRALPGFSPEQIPAGAASARFMPPANTGMGFLDAVSDSFILLLADPADLNGDGISGIPNWIVKPAYATPRTQAWVRSDGRYIGRFGKKAAAYDLLQQTASAYNQDMGITSSYEPRDVYTGQDIDPEVSNTTIQNVVFYLKTLKAPVPRNTANADVNAGKQLFISTGCGKCHTPVMQTGFSTIASLSHKEFYPYTDLLLHDMGPGLDDGYTEGTAKTSEWRTPALWGLGLSKKSQGGTYFLLHDGRARSIEEAILLHGGESTFIIIAYKNLPESDKKKLHTFLESL